MNEIPKDLEQVFILFRTIHSFMHSFILSISILEYRLPKGFSLHIPVSVLALSISTSEYKKLFAKFNWSNQVIHNTYVPRRRKQRISEIRSACGHGSGLGIGYWIGYGYCVLGRALVCMYVFRNFKVNNYYFINYYVLIIIITQAYSIHTHTQQPTAWLQFTIATCNLQC